MQFTFIEEYLCVVVLAYLGRMTEIRSNNKNMRRICDMNFKEIFPYAFSVLVGICIWTAAYMTLFKKIQQDIDILNESNKHEIEKLMNQHKLDMDSLIEQHKMDLEKIEKEHQNKIQLLEIEHENEMRRKEKELEDTAKYGAVRDIVGGLFGGVVSNAMGSSDLQEEISKQIKEGLKGGNIME